VKRTCFADSFYFLALLNERDASHALAHEFTRSQDVMFVTTWPVLTELIDALVDGYWRGRVVGFVDRLLTLPNVLVVPPSEGQCLAGLRLFDDRPDKSWSLTDCISFVVMQEQDITEALMRQAFRAGGVYGAAAGVRRWVAL